MANITRDQIITKHATLDDTGAARHMGDYVVLVVPDPGGGTPLLVAVQDEKRDYVYRCHAHDLDKDKAKLSKTEADAGRTARRDYAEGSWEALITA